MKINMQAITSQHLGMQAITSQQQHLVMLHVNAACCGRREMQQNSAASGVTPLGVPRCAVVAARAGDLLRCKCCAVSRRLLGLFSYSVLDICCISYYACCTLYKGESNA
jgi:hypothetical protein